MNAEVTEKPPKRKFGCYFIKLIVTIIYFHGPNVGLSSLAPQENNSINHKRNSGSGI